MQGPPESLGIHRGLRGMGYEVVEGGPVYVYYRRGGWLRVAVSIDPPLRVAVGGRVDLGGYPLEPGVYRVRVWRVGDLSVAGEASLVVSGGSARLEDEGWPGWGVAVELPGGEALESSTLEVVRRLRPMMVYGFLGNLQPLAPLYMASSMKWSPPLFLVPRMGSWEPPWSRRVPGRLKIVYDAGGQGYSESSFLRVLSASSTALL